MAYQASSYVNKKSLIVSTFFYRLTPPLATAVAVHGSSGQACLGYLRFNSFFTSK
jgi:hypothetical protein